MDNCRQANQVEDIALQLNQRLSELEHDSKNEVEVADVSRRPLAEDVMAADEKGRETTTEYITMPDDYVNDLFLTFALFGRPSSSDDSDLALTPNSGPNNEKGRTSGGVKLEEDGDDDVDTD